jgi:hypothetical protein
MSENIYREEIRSNKTDLLFVVLALITYALSAWKFSVVGFKFGSGLFLFLGLLFTFYVINFRVLNISITEQTLHLKFGVIPWKIELSNIQEIILDDAPMLIKYGGAGVHFAFVKGEYRAFYNFLEYPRVLIRFKKKQGLVKALVFTTQQPEQILEIIQENLPKI